MSGKVENEMPALRIGGALQAPNWSAAVSFGTGQPPVLPMICQDAATGQVLMQGYVSQETLAESLSSGQVVFWSRSRRMRWKKGETSGHVLNIRRVLLDCDGDSLLAMVEPQGPACHRHSQTCFDAETGSGGFERTEVGWSIAARLFEQICDRARGGDRESYTFKLLNAGTDRVLRKLGEECTELILAAKNSTITGDAQEFCQESADLLYHWLVTVKSVGVRPEDVFKVLASREGGPRRAAGEKI